MYGGAVQVESELGKGTRFTLEFPARILDEVIQMNWPLPPVLVVDDEKNMRLSLKSILSGEGYDLQAGGIGRRGHAACWKRRSSSWSSPTPGWAEG